jgi:hypothetical protein
VTYVEIMVLHHNNLCSYVVEDTRITRIIKPELENKVHKTVILDVSYIQTMV